MKSKGNGTQFELVGSASHESLSHQVSTALSLKQSAQTRKYYIASFVTVTLIKTGSLIECDNKSEIVAFSGQIVR